MKDRKGTRGHLLIQKVEDGLQLRTWKNIHKRGNRQGKTIARVRYGNMNLQYLGKIGNVFNSFQIDKAIELGEQYSLDKIPINDYTLHSIGVDVGFGSSSTAIVLTEFLKEESKIRVLICRRIRTC